MWRRGGPACQTRLWGDRRGWCGGRYGRLRNARAEWSGRAVGRVGQGAISGYLGPKEPRNLSTAPERNTGLHALIGEAFDNLTRKYGKHLAREC
ncbi:ribbon-helix-helix domain-containing protein [Phenylobacterium conjunctum]|uniref:Ribbon-helix-helix domain-containing protein n=1 Tax=Phenylobacterium conjunctum TaxID=1298959 RepID=A0ABW3T182_9CAUL